MRLLAIDAKRSHETLAAPDSMARAASSHITSGDHVKLTDIRGKVDFGILTIRPDEFDAVLQRFTPFARVHGKRQYNVSRVGLAGGDSYLVAVVRCAEQGTGEAQDAARDLLEDLDPRWLLVVGIGGGFPSDEFTLGDVVVSTRIHDFTVEAVLQDRQSEFAIAGGPIHKDASAIIANLPALKEELKGWNSAASIGIARPQIAIDKKRLYGGKQWREKVKNALARHESRTEPLVTSGAMASSDRLIKDTEIVNVWLKIARQAIAVEMESAGVYRAAHGRQIPFVAIRGISDVVGFKRDQGWLDYACHTAAAFTLALLRARQIEPAKTGTEAMSMVAPERTMDHASASDRSGAELNGDGAVKGVPRGTDSVVPDKHPRIEEENVDRIKDVDATALSMPSITDVVILHLSDLQIATPNDLVLKKAEAVARTTNVISHPVDLWVLLVTGDIVQNGKREEYMLAEQFLSDIRNHLINFHPSGQVALVLAPGNQDCDFALHTGTRQLLLQQIAVNPDAVDLSVATTCTEVQRPFFEFMARMEGRNDPILNGTLSYTRQFVAGSAAVRFNCYNTAWISHPGEKKGDVMFPLQETHLLPPPGDADACAVSISVFHHPLAWFRADNRRLFQSHLERISDIVFTGYDKKPGPFHQQYITDHAVEYCEGGALQLDRTSSESELNLIEIDVASRKHRLTRYEWDRGQYARKTGYSDWMPFVYGAERKAGLAFTDDFERVLSDPGAQFTHPARDKLLLDDIFVYPDLNELRIPPTNRQLQDIRGGLEISNRLGPTDLSRAVIYGADDCGKSTLIKRLCRDLTRRRFAVIVLASTSFTSSDTDDIERAVRKQELFQYGPERAARVAQMEPSRRVVLIDDFQSINIDRQRLLDILGASFGTIVILGGEMLKLQELPFAMSKTNPFYDFKRFEILPMGHERRAKLVERWFDLSRQAGADEELLAKKARLTLAAIQMSTNNDLVPSYPLFLLVIIQTVEAASPVDSPATHSRSYGYLHEALITRALTDNAPTDIDTSSKYLSELAFRMFLRNARRLSEVELRAQHAAYCDDYKMPLSFDRMLSFLERVGVLYKGAGGQYSFKYKYLYHYFVARTLRDDSRRFDEHVPRLIDGLHRDQSASILMFLVHLVRDDRILDRMLMKARALYASASKCDLVEDVACLSAMQVISPELVLPATSPEDNQQQMLTVRDKNVVASSPDENAEESETDEFNDIVRVNAALKTISILGQIVKSFPGSTLGSRKREIVNECYSLGLRAMKALLGLIIDNKNDIARDLAQHLRDKNVSETEVGGRATEIIYWLSEMWVLLFVLKTSEAVGLHDLWQTYDEIASGDPSLGIALIDLSVRLENFPSFPENTVEDLIRRTARIPFTRGILTRLIYRHLYLYKTDHRIKERLAARLKIRTSSLQAPQLESRFRKN